MAATGDQPNPMYRTMYSTQVGYAEGHDVGHAAGYGEGYKAGRIAALREVGCWKMWAGADCRQRPITYAQWCHRCRLLAEAENG